LQLLAEGRSSKEIADRMEISPRTVEFHKTMIMSKLGARSSADLIKYAVKHGLVA
jgi:DNA-binding CsgD family transcriptional regulator